MSRVYYRFSIENKGHAIENLDPIMDEAERVAQAAIDIDLSQIDPHDLLMILSKVTVKRYNRIEELALAGRMDEANAMMLDTYRNLASYGLALGAHIK